MMAYNSDCMWKGGASQWILPRKVKIQIFKPKPEREIQFSLIEEKKECLAQGNAFTKIRQKKIWPIIRSRLAVTGVKREHRGAGKTLKLWTGQGISLCKLLYLFHLYLLRSTFLTPPLSTRARFAHFHVTVIFSSSHLV